MLARQSVLAWAAQSQHVITAKESKHRHTWIKENGIRFPCQAASFCILTTGTNQSAAIAGTTASPINTPTYCAVFGSSELNR